MWAVLLGGDGVCTSASPPVRIAPTSDTADTQHAAGSTAPGARPADGRHPESDHPESVSNDNLKGFCGASQYVCHAQLCGNAPAECAVAQAYEAGSSASVWLHRWLARIPSARSSSPLRIRQQDEYTNEPR